MNIREFAKILNVSPATVSLALNNKKGVSEATRMRITEEAIRLNYVSAEFNKDANILLFKYKKHGMLVEENAGFITSMADSIERTTRRLGYNLIMMVADGSMSLDEQLSQIDFTKFEGAIFLGTELSRSEYNSLNLISKPYVVVDNNMPNFPRHSVAIDNTELVFKALFYLKQSGHRRMAYFSSKHGIQNFTERRRAVYSVVKELGLEIIDEYKLGPTLLGAYEDMADYLNTSPKLPSCAFADNDSIAIGAMKALQEYHIDIPDDISIIGLDDIIYAKINSPSLTTMRVHKEEIGAITVRHLHQLIESECEAIQKIRVGGELIVRGSTKQYGR